VAAGRCAVKTRATAIEILDNEEILFIQTFHHYPLTIGRTETRSGEPTTYTGAPLVGLGPQADVLLALRQNIRGGTPSARAGQAR
jgi:hypothetical protein